MDEAFNIALQGSGVFNESHSESRAIISELDNDSIVVIPISGNKAVVFNNRNEMEEFISKNGIPIEEQSGNVFARNQNIIKNIDQNIQEVIEKLKNLLDFDVYIDTNSTYLKKLSTACTKYIRKNGKDTAYQELYFLISIFCGELIKKHLSRGQWIINQRYGVNPYFEPALIDGEEEFHIFKAILDEIFRNKLNIINCLNLALPVNERINLT